MKCYFWLIRPLKIKGLIELFDDLLLSNPISNRSAQAMTKVGHNNFRRKICLLKKKEKQSFIIVTVLVWKSSLVIFQRAAYLLLNLVFCHLEHFDSFIPWIASVKYVADMDFCNLNTKLPKYIVLFCFVSFFKSEYFEQT